MLDMFVFNADGEFLEKIQHETRVSLKWHTGFPTYVRGSTLYEDGWYWRVFSKGYLPKIQEMEDYEIPKQAKAYLLLLL